MTAVTYENLALDWRPESKRDHLFNVIAIVVLLVMISSAIILSFIDLPKEERKARAVVPERVADFILKKEKPKVVKPKPKPKPKPQIKSKVRKKPKPDSKKPLTKEQKSARKKAEASGLLALGNELADLMDTSEINSMVGKKISRSSSSAPATSVDKGILTAGATKGSGGVDSDKYTSSVSNTTLTDQQRIAIRQSLGTSGTSATSGKSAKSKGRSGNVRAEEDIIFILDKNKSKLHSLYRRARRHNPGLKGRIVFLITIAPSGKVTKVTIKSSELNDKKLEKQLVSRLKGYNFGKTSHETVTVTFPLEFVPS